MQQLTLATGTITTADAAAITVPAGQIWEITSITTQQPGTGVAKVVQIGFGTTATAANVKWNVNFAAGLGKDIFYPGWSLQPAATLNVVASAGTTECVYTVNGLKHVIT